MIVDIKKSYRTRGGCGVRIYAIDGTAPYPIHGAIKRNNGWEEMVWTRDGRWAMHFDNEDDDLVEAKPRIKRTVWINHYDPPVASGSYWFSEEAAKDSAMRGGGLIARSRHEIDLEVGDGL